MATPRTIFAHCIYLSDDEWDRAAELRCGVSHCPDSNFFLRSGQMNMEAVRTRGVKLGLGSDVGAGRTFSLLKAASSAYDTAGLVGVDVSAEQLLWYATRGGAEVMGLEDKVGLIEPGFQADLIALSVDASSSADLASQYEKLVFQSDHEPVLASYVRGRRVWARP